MKAIEEKLSAYEVDVGFPHVSGMEHLQMLMTRSELRRVGDLLTTEQQVRLANADQKLLQHSQQFHQAIQSIADLTSLRETETGVTPEHWWWYLDVLAQLPSGTVTAEFDALPVDR